jgi:signal transduction histidine kinase
LRNVERHAGASKVAVSLRTVDEHGPALQMEIVDDGVGFEPETPHPGHYGLVGLREQAQLIGAQLVIVSEPRQGTRVTLMLRLGDHGSAGSTASA